MDARGGCHGRCVVLVIFDPDNDRSKTPELEFGRAGLPSGTFATAQLYQGFLAQSLSVARGELRPNYNDPFV